MKFKKSKVLTETETKLEKGDEATFFAKRRIVEQMSPKEVRLQQEEKLRLRTERIRKLKKRIGQFFTILFVIAVIFSMIAVPLIIVFG